ncbi:MAG: gamma carbonic anhydrase family protein [Candidatus Omnitrophota bacterium]
MIGPFNHKAPRLHPSVFVAPGAHLIGDVRIARGSSVWFGAVLRADLASIIIGKNTNIQDNSVLHVDVGVRCVLGDGIIMGHQATAHGCVVGAHSLIGIGARILNGAQIGPECVIGAQAVVLENARIPARSLVVGIPGKIVRRLSASEVKHYNRWAMGYVRLAAQFRKQLG